MKIATVVLVLILAISGLALSEEPSDPPSPSPPEISQPPKAKTERKQDKPQPDYRGTEKQPIFHEVITTKQTEEEAAKLDEDRKEKSAHDESLVVKTGHLVLATIALAVFTFFLMIFTYRLWQANKKLVQRAYTKIALRQMQAKGNVIYLFGEIRYSIASILPMNGEERTTRFLYIHRGPRYQWEQCAEGNRAT